MKYFEYCVLMDEDGFLWMNPVSHPYVNRRVYNMEDASTQVCWLLAENGVPLTCTQGMIAYHLYSVEDPIAVLIQVAKIIANTKCVEDNGDIDNMRPPIVSAMVWSSVERKFQEVWRSDEVTE